MCFFSKYRYIIKYIRWYLRTDIKKFVYGIGSNFVWRNEGMNRITSFILLVGFMLISIWVYSVIDNKFAITYKIADKVKVPNKWKTLVIITSFILIGAFIMVFINKYLDTSKITSNIFTGILSGFLVSMANKLDKKYKRHFNI